MPVVVDVPVVTATLVGAVSPQVVRVVVTGLTAGQSVQVVGSAVGQEWEVRGGTLTASAEQVAVVDVLAPLNVPVNYIARVEGADYTTSTPVTVAYAGRYVMQSLDGRTVLPFVWQDNGLPRVPGLRSVSYPVPGRPSSPARWDVSEGLSGQARVRMSRAASDALLALLASGGPILAVRTDGQVRDFPPAELWLLTSAGSALWGAVVNGAPSTDRVWTLGYDVIEDPEPGVIVAASTWDDFDAAQARTTWDDFDAAWAGSTWDEFDLTDWSAV